MARVTSAAVFVALTFTIAIPSLALDPQLAVERVKTEVRGVWSIVSISRGESTLVPEHVAGATWVDQPTTR